MATGAVEVAGHAAAGGAELRFQYALAGGVAAGQASALVLDTPAGVSPYDRLAFASRSDRPMRISVQLRNGAGDRWQRSVYLDPAARERIVAFHDMTPIGTAAPQAPGPDVRSILFVVDTTNTKPGTSGRVWIRSAALHK
jgi:hypothetical protein